MGMSGYYIAVDDALLQDVSSMERNLFLALIRRVKKRLTSTNHGREFISSSVVNRLKAILPWGMSFLCSMTTGSRVNRISVRSTSRLRRHVWF